MDEDAQENQHEELIVRDVMMTLREDCLREALQVNEEAMNDAQFKLQPLLYMDLSGEDRRYANLEIDRTEDFVEELRAERLRLQTDYDHARAQRSDIAEFMEAVNAASVAHQVFFHILNFLAQYGVVNFTNMVVESGIQILQRLAEKSLSITSYLAEREAFLESLRAQRLQLLVYYNHTRTQLEDVAEFIRQLLGS
ncbi:hypothetical protein PITC_069940 [Penicillium italicum]|uniref:Uncharacterized protein n=1 Tax=Penicillium italicum TaxID=40296 RepID=A0A0A2L559_PENIT|nr:hypothetical protein PITC_069940 [Penicillium italicum]